MGVGRFRALIHGVPQSLTFRAFLGDTQSDPVSVSVLLPPVVLDVKCTEVYPAYTKLPPEPRPTGDLSLLAGSTLRVSAAASAPIRQGSIHLAGLEKDVAMTIDAVGKKTPHGEIPIPKEGLTGFSIRLVDEDRIPSRETAVYRIDIIPDRPPSIKITHPAQDETATAGAIELIAFHAEDDFGVARVSLHYSVNDGAESVIDFDLSGDVPRQLDRRFEWKLASLKLAPGGSIVSWMEATDANDVTGPGKGVTDKVRIKIVTPEEKRTELAGRMTDALGALDGMSQSEDDLSKRLGTRIFQKPEAKKP